MGYNIGIDLGTTNSAGAVYRDGKVQVIKSREGNAHQGKMFPSVVIIPENGFPIVGEFARQKKSHYKKERVITKIKRLMGTDYRTPQINNREYTPELISSFILGKIRDDAKHQLGNSIEGAVITIPANFNNNQREATLRAADMCGLTVIELLPEPTAAALAYGIHQEDKTFRTIVLDLGSGTFDVSVFKVKGHPEIEKRSVDVQGLDGDPQLGGSDMDAEVMDWIVKQAKNKYHIELNDQDRFMLEDIAENAKIELTTQPSTTIHYQKSSEMMVELDLEKEVLEELISNILRRLIPPIEKALTKAALSKSDIDKLILIGGPTRMPCVRKLFGDYFGKEPEPSAIIDEMDAVARGAAIQAAGLGINCTERSPHAFGTDYLDYETGRLVTGNLIPTNSRYPCSFTKEFFNHSDNQTSMYIGVCQGDDPIFEKNLLLGEFTLPLKPKPHGENKVQVTFSLDMNGVLKTKALDEETGVTKEITIQGAIKKTDKIVSDGKREYERVEEGRRQRGEIDKILGEGKACAIMAGNLIKSQSLLDISVKQRLEALLEKLNRSINTEELTEVKKLVDEIHAQIDALKKG